MLHEFVSWNLKTSYYSWNWAWKFNLNGICTLILLLNSLRMRNSAKYFFETSISHEFCLTFNLSDIWIPRNLIFGKNFKIFSSTPLRKTTLDTFTKNFFATFSFDQWEKFNFTDSFSLVKKLLNNSYVVQTLINKLPHRRILIVHIVARNSFVLNKRIILPKKDKVH